MRIQAEPLQGASICGFSFFFVLLRVHRALRVD